MFIPEERRDTICFHRSPGATAMQLCLTAQLGLLRSLTAGEIVEQIVFVLNDAYDGERPAWYQSRAWARASPFRF